MMPYERPRCESDPVASLLKSPAQVDIVPRLAIGRIKTLDVQKDLSAKGHVATRDVFCNLITFKHVCWLARRRRHAGGQAAVFRSKVWSSHPCRVRLLK